MKNLLVLLTLLLTFTVHAEVNLETIEHEDLSILTASGQFVPFGEISGIGGKIAMNKVDSFVTIKNEIIPLTDTKVFFPEGKAQTLDNVLGLGLKDNSTLKRAELLGVILK